MASTKFTISDLKNQTEKIFDAANHGPVDLTSHERRKYVILTAEEFDRMAERHQQRRLHIQAAVKRMSKVRKERDTPQHADPR